MISLFSRLEARSRSQARFTSRAERFLGALGADPDFLEAVLGDIAEEFAGRVARDGGGRARLWYAREMVRTAPHVVGSGIRYACRHGRVPRAAVLGALLLAPLLVVALFTRDDAATQLIAGTAGGVVINDVSPTRLPVRVLDAAGHLLHSTDVRYHWVSGAPMSVSRDGVVTCREMGDATIRASLGRLSANVALHCRPVRNVWTTEPVQLLVGDSAQRLPIGAMGLDGRRVTMLAGEMRGADSAVVALEGMRVRPVGPGFTVVNVRVGGHETTAEVNVYEPVHSLAELRPGQRLVAARVRLSPGQAIRWPLPEGVFWMRIGEDPDAHIAPAVTLDGPVVCMPSPGATPHQAHCRVRESGAFVTMTHPGTDSRKVTTILALEREEVRQP